MAAGLEDGVSGARPMNGVLKEPFIDAVELLNLARGGGRCGTKAPGGFDGEASADGTLAVGGKLEGRYIPYRQSLDGFGDGNEQGVEIGGLGRGDRNWVVGRNHVQLRNRFWNMAVATA
jgi:hypothetical protein